MLQENRVSLSIISIKTISSCHDFYEKIIYYSRGQIFCSFGRYECSLWLTVFNDFFKFMSPCVCFGQSEEKRIVQLEPRFNSSKLSIWIFWSDVQNILWSNNSFYTSKNYTTRVMKLYIFWQWSLPIWWQCDYFKINITRSDHG